MINIRVHKIGKVNKIFRKQFVSNNWKSSQRIEFHTHSEIDLREEIFFFVLKIHFNYSYMDKQNEQRNEERKKLIKCFAKKFFQTIS